MIAINQFGRTPSERRALTRTGYKYVALGDSFSAGEGVEEFFEKDNRCHRSKLAYSTFVRRPGQRTTPIYKERKPSVIDWGFQACSGAVAKNVLDRRDSSRTIRITGIRSRSSSGIARRTTAP